MTEKELKQLSRADLLEMLIAQSVELREMQKKLQSLEAQLNERQIMIDKAWSIAEAALSLNGVFEAAQAASAQYVESICALNARQDEICRKREAESVDQANAMRWEAEKYCAALKEEAEEYCANLKRETEQKCAVMMRQLVEANVVDAAESQYAPDEAETAEMPEKKRWRWRWRRENVEKA